MSTRLPTRIALFLTLLICNLGMAEEAAKPDAAKSDATVSYWNDIRPIFQVHCQGCHQPAKPGGEYVMTNFESLKSGGETHHPPLPTGCFHS